jgi:hypothetical protein
MGAEVILGSSTYSTTTKVEEETSNICEPCIKGQKDAHGPHLAPATCPVERLMHEHDDPGQL